MFPFFTRKFCDIYLDLFSIRINAKCFILIGITDILYEKGDSCFLGDLF